MVYSPCMYMPSSCLGHMSASSSSIRACTTHRQLHSSTPPYRRVDAERSRKISPSSYDFFFLTFYPFFNKTIGSQQPCSHVFPFQHIFSLPINLISTPPSLTSSETSQQAIAVIPNPHNPPPYPSSSSI